MSKVINKKGITLVGLIITIIVLIVLTGAVIMTAVNVPSNAQLAIFKSNVGTIQDAVMIKMSSNMVKYAQKDLALYKWIGVIEGYTEEKAANKEQPMFNSGYINGENVSNISSEIKSTLNITEEEASKYYVGKSGTVYHEGYVINGKTYYNGSIEIVGEKPVIKEEGEVKPTDGSYYAAKGVNSPLLSQGMVAVYWDSNGNEITSASSNFDYDSWYNYEAQTGATTNGGTSKWANAKTADGSYWVWIPRYAYAITSGYHGEGLTYVDGVTQEAGTIEIEFLKGTTNECAETSRTFAEAAGARNWNVHPAFYYDGTSATGTQLAGIWVAKYEMSMETNGTATETTESNGNIATSSTVKAVSKPGVTAWRWINRSNIFTNALNYDTTSVSNANLDSHLMKNSEWGAVAYLAHSKYGRNATEIRINDATGYYTAGGSGATAHTNVLQSTTGNCYGIFDISGCSTEHMAAYMDGASATATPGSNGASLINAASKYKDVYDAADSTSDYSERNDVRVYGDGIWETSSACYFRNSDKNIAGWYADDTKFVDSTYPFFYRGGSYDIGTDAGAFAFGMSDGIPRINHSWRVVLWGAL